VPLDELARRREAEAQALEFADTVLALERAGTAICL
jgi:hypothetical protein